MKKLNIVMLVSLMVLLGLAIAYADGSYDVPVSAQIPNMPPDLFVEIKELSAPLQDPATGVEVSNMDFGALTHLLDGGAEAGAWFSKKYFCVVAYPTSFGKKYQIKSACAGLDSGANSLAGAFVVTPVYVAEAKWADGRAQGDKPAGAIVGDAALAVGDRSIYTSEAAGANRILRAYYGIPNTSTVGTFAPVELSQPAGTYTGTVTVTIAAV